MRFIMPIVLIGISIAIFFVFTSPIYNGITELRAQSASYNEALGNSKALENERDKLTAKYNAIDPNNLLKLQKLLPDNIDNIRLILEIEQIAAPYGMVLKDVRYNATTQQTTGTTSVAGAIQGGGGTVTTNKDYGVWDLEFSTVGTYSNFLNFTRDIESNLRIVDISSIQFSSDSVTKVGLSQSSSSADAYKYDFKIKTYWLKN
jgi:hypothetical protein